MRSTYPLVASLLLIAACGDQTPVRKYGEPIAQAGKTAPGPSKPRPAWVEHPPQEPGRLFAAGGAPSREEAIRKGRNEIAAQISVTVKSVTQSETSEQQLTTSGGQRIARAYSSYQEKIELEVEQRDLPGTSVIEEADCGSEKWALVAFERSIWARSLRTQIGDIDNKLVAERDRWKAAGGALPATVTAFRSTGPLGAEREALLKRLRTADPAGALPACPVDLAKLKQVLARQLDDLTIKLSGASGADLLDARIQSALAKTGITVMSDGDTTLVAKLETRLVPRALPGGLTRYNGSLQATISSADGRVLGTIPVEDSAADAVEEQAKGKCLDNLAAKLSAAINEQLLELLAK